MYLTMKLFHKNVFLKTNEAVVFLAMQVDKANQRLLDNNTSLMYTAEASVANKLGDAQGWRDVLQSAGFRLRKAAKSLPDAIFFPLKDDKGKLRQCGDILRALLGKLRWFGDILRALLGKLRQCGDILRALLGKLRQRGNILRALLGKLR